MVIQVSSTCMMCAITCLLLFVVTTKIKQHQETLMRPSQGQDCPKAKLIAAKQNKNLYS